MKVCHFINNPYTYDTRVKKECEALAETGFDVVCVGVRSNGFQDKETVKGVKVVRCQGDLSDFLKWLRLVLGNRSIRLHDLYRLVFLPSFQRMKQLGTAVLNKSKQIKIRSRYRYSFAKERACSTEKTVLELEQARSVDERESVNEWIRTQYAFPLTYHIRFWVVFWGEIIALPLILCLIILKSIIWILFRIFDALGSALKDMIKGVVVLAIGDASLFSQLLAGLYQKADIYQANDFDRLAVAWLCAKRNDAYLVYDSHELYDESFPRRKPFFKRYLIRLVEKKLSGEADKCVTVCESISQILKKRYDLSERPLVVLNSQPFQERVEPSDYIREFVPNSDGHLLCVYAGLITKGRGLIDLAEVVNKMPYVQVILMGNVAVDFRGTLEEMLKKYSNTGRFHVLPPVSSEILPSVLSVCDVGVAATETACLSYYYGLGNKLFHYLNAGLCLLTVDQVEKRSLVERYKNGLFVKELNSENLASKLTEMYENPEALREMKRQSRKAAQELSWDREKSKYVDMYLSIYEEALFETDFSLNPSVPSKRMFDLCKGLFYVFLTSRTFHDSYVIYLALGRRIMSRIHKKPPSLTS
jgi:glycosyltransferase involved in cell wall biosynthesis